MSEAGKKAGMNKKLKKISEKLQKTSFLFYKEIQCPLDIATDLRQGGWGRYRQCGRYIKGLYEMVHFYK